MTKKILLLTMALLLCVSTALAAGNTTLDFWNCQPYAEQKCAVYTGPGVNYAVEWLYMKSGLPVEILQEFDNWRRIRDSEGSEGWVNQTLLSGRRTAIVAPWQAGKVPHLNERISANLRLG